MYEFTCVFRAVPAAGCGGKMGAGASSDVAAKVEAATADDLKATVAGLSSEDKAKLLTALNGGKKQSALVSPSTLLTLLPCLSA